MFVLRQETLRFENPQLAFTYHVHGYESVVGPVKGVYNKPELDAARTPPLRAREHTILINDRPPYVSILTLVREAAARLPNGCGTRADIVELLKYSQYVSPAAPDGLVHSVVSGALDRLHYEPDPCVKFSSARKMWVYLHRNRSEHDFSEYRLHGWLATFLALTLCVRVVVHCTRVYCTLINVLVVSDKIHASAGKLVKAKQALSKPRGRGAALKVNCGHAHSLICYADCSTGFNYPSRGLLV